MISKTYYRYIWLLDTLLTRVRLRPTFDFRQEILTMGSDIEVLSPKWFREELAEISEHMWDKYKEDKR